MHARPLRPPTGGGTRSPRCGECCTDDCELASQARSIGRSAKRLVTFGGPTPRSRCSSPARTTSRCSMRLPMAISTWASSAPAFNRSPRSSARARSPARSWYSRQAATMPSREARARRSTACETEAFVTLVHGSGHREAFDNAFDNAGYTPRIAAEAGELSSLVELVAEGLGIAIIPRAAAEGANVAVLGITQPRLLRRRALAWNQASASPAARAFLALVARSSENQSSSSATRTASRTSTSRPSLSAAACSTAFFTSPSSISPRSISVAVSRGATG